MSMQDPISDMLTRIRNAVAAELKTVSMPSSKIKAAIAEVLKTEGYIDDYSVSAKAEDSPLKELVIELKYYKDKPVIEGLQRISKPSCRRYCGSGEVPRVRNGLGTVVLSTPAGIVSGKAAASQKIGGEILCTVW